MPREERRRRIAAFDSIRIDHPRQDQLHNRVLNLIDDTKAAIARTEAKRLAAGNRPVKAEELWMLPVVGPSGATKSTSMETLVNRLLSDPELSGDAIPILTVTVRSSTRTPKHIQGQILEQFNDPAAETILTDRTYTEARVNESLRRIARQRQTSVVVLDEVHSALVQTRGANAKALATLFKSIVNDGIFSLVLMGTEEMEPILQHREGQSRFWEPVSLGRFSLARGDINYFLSFVAQLEIKMIEMGVIDRPIGLLSDTTSQAQIYDIADGVVGTVSRILRISLDRAFEDGRTDVTLDDVRDAFVQWKRTKDNNGTLNPFGKEGPKRNTLGAMRSAAEAAL